MSRELEDSIDDNPEETDDNGEDNEDADPAEPSLGSVSNFAHSNQERWSDGGRPDIEQDDAEFGIGDQDRLDEQAPFRDWQCVGMV